MFFLIVGLNAAHVCEGVGVGALWCVLCAQVEELGSKQSGLLLVGCFVLILEVWVVGNGWDGGTQL